MPDENQTAVCGFHEDKALSQALLPEARFPEKRKPSILKKSRWTATNRLRVMLVKLMVPEPGKVWGGMEVLEECNNIKRQLEKRDSGGQLREEQKHLYMWLRSCIFCRKNSEPVFISGECWMDEGFRWQTRKFSAGILTDFKGN